MKVLYFDSHSKGVFHQMFNLCFLHSIAEIADEVDCYTNYTTQEFIIRSNKEHSYSNISIRDIWVYRPNSNSKVSTVLRMLFSALQNLRLCFCKGYDAIFLSYNTPFFLVFLSLYSVLNPRTKLYIACHGEVENLIARPTGVMSRITKFLEKRYFIKKRIPENIKFIVLGQSILDNLLPLVRSENKDKFYTINHPFYFGDVKNEARVDNTTLTVGTVGVCNYDKGLNDLLELSKRLSGKVNVRVIGRVTDKKDVLESRGVTVTDEYLPREKFEEKIKELDCTLYFYPKDSYKLTASGAVFDAVKLHKPIIAYRNDYFLYIKNEANYPIIFVDNVDEMEQAILNFHPSLSGTTESAYEKFGVKHVSNQLRIISGLN